MGKRGKREGDSFNFLIRKDFIFCFPDILSPGVLCVPTGCASGFKLPLCPGWAILEEKNGNRPTVPWNFESGLLWAAPASVQDWWWSRETILFARQPPHCPQCHAFLHGGPQGRAWLFPLLCPHSGKPLHSREAKSQARAKALKLGLSSPAPSSSLGSPCLLDIPCWVGSEAGISPVSGLPATPSAPSPG